MESDMYSMAQHAVANGYGKIEYLRAQPIALSSRVSTMASPRSACSPEVASRGFGGAMRLATSTFVLSGDHRPVKARLQSAGTRASGARAMDALTRWVHLLGVAVYLGATLAVALVFLPAMEAVEEPALQRRLLARGLRPYNVLSVGAPGVLVISGASGLTDMKAMLGPAFGRLVWRLAGKLALSFLLINVATYFSFGLAHRLVRAELGQLPVEPEKQAGMIRRMRGAAWLGVALAAWTAWVGVGMGR